MPSPGSLRTCQLGKGSGVTGSRATVELPPVAGRDDDDTRKINWYWIAAWTGIGVALLCLAGALEGLWEWTGVSIGIMVHVGGTLLLAPLLPFLEKSLTRRVVQENKRMVQQETAGLREQVDSLATRIDQLQAIVEEQDAENVQDQDRIIEALSEEVSFMNVASAMTVANMLGALPEGEITLHASTDPRIDLPSAGSTTSATGASRSPAATSSASRLTSPPIRRWHDTGHPDDLEADREARDGDRADQ